MRFDHVLCAIILLSMGKYDCKESKSLTRRKRYLLEPSGTQMGIFGTIAIPLENMSQVSVAYFIEENWYTVDNASWFRGDFEGPEVSSARSGRSISKSIWSNTFTRRYTYIILENNIERHNLPGRACLLRAICEHALFPFHHNGVLGDMLYIVFTPSTSKDEGLPEVFYEAEEKGKAGICHKYQKTCPSSLIDSISCITDIL